MAERYGPPLDLGHGGWALMDQEKLRPGARINERAGQNMQSEHRNSCHILVAVARHLHPKVSPRGRIHLGQFAHDPLARRRRPRATAKRSLRAAPCDARQGRAIPRTGASASQPDDGQREAAHA